jgi:hypothetical protein
VPIKSGLQNLLASVTSLREMSRLPLFHASLALAAFFGGLVVVLDDKRRIQVRIFTILPLHDKIKPPTLYECFLTSKGECYSEPETFIDSESNLCKVSSLTTSPNGGSSAIPSTAQ